MCSRLCKNAPVEAVQDTLCLDPMYDLPVGPSLRLTRRTATAVMKIPTTTRLAAKETCVQRHHVRTDLDARHMFGGFIAIITTDTNANDLSNRTILTTF